MRGGNEKEMNIKKKKEEVRDNRGRGRWGEEWIVKKKDRRGERKQKGR